ncbi:MAG: valine--tRNA ligase [Clostridia bacterium]|nr:valine--tRNA ligase [Clostridia bacterium]
MLEGKYDAKKSEKKWQDFWEETGIYKFDTSGEKGEIYSIDNPPPTVNGKIHIGHVFSYTQIEMIARYMRMKGYNVFYPFGFDDNGLPTERLVEKQIGKKANQLSREEFTKLCLETTAKYEEQFKELFKSLGFSADWDYMYSTMGEKAQRTSQKSFIDLYNKGKLHHEEKPCLWCSECQTSIAQAELETKEVETKFNYLNFRIPELNENLEIATTRPELLPGCVAVFVNPKDEKKAKYIGKEIEVPLLGYKVKILGDDKVELDKGTGAVMCCTFGDATDVEWCRKYNLPTKQIIQKDGRISSEVENYGGMTISDAREAIIRDLSKEGYLLKQEDLMHQTGVHERCGTPAEFVREKQWEIDLVEDKERLLKAGSEVNWNPKSMKARYDDWVKNIQWNWGISRQRYFGIPFPVWYCKGCGDTILAKEEDLPVNPLSTKPSEPCPCCGGTDFEPEKDVMDTWATSSLTPLINAEWAKDENGELMNKIFPMSLRANAHDIIRTWDFYTIAKSLYHTGELPWKDIMVAGHVLAQKGEKISKRKSNGSMEPEKLLERYSADAIRYWTAGGRLGNDVMFSEETLREGNKFINKLWNAAKFATMNLQDYNPEEAKDIELLPMDKWTLSKLAKMKQEYDDNFSKYEPALALNAYQKYFWDYCDNYVEIAKHRLYNPDLYGEDAKKSAQKATYDSMLQLLKMGSVYLPHVTEEIYQGFFKDKEKKESIHIMDIDDFEYEADKDLIESGNRVVDIISGIRKYKSENNMSLRTPIKSADIEVEPQYKEFVESAMQDIKNTGTLENANLEVGANTNVSSIEIDKEALERINEEKRKKKEAQQQQKKFAESDFKSAYEGQVVDGNIIKDMLKDEKVQEKDEVEK